mmetsp:Transcript_87751/g.174176  ORF Transcript_87751/g.174176 Transcript_87751/m.174176 type:complete len:218 (-) Transcript_87751:443-1096(-)
MLNQDSLKSLKTMKSDGVGEVCCRGHMSRMDARAPQSLPDTCDSWGNFLDNTYVVDEPVHAWEAPVGKTQVHTHVGVCSPHPPIPSNPCFRLEPTTVHVHGTAACSLWICLRRFFEAWVGASITKANHEKHSIKANVVTDVGMFTVKVRIYAGNRGALVELQRRLGDSVGFNRIFACLSRHIAEQLPSALVFPVAPVAGELLSAAPHVAWGAAAKEL